ncbi:MAG: FeoA domain protein [Clostridiales bacterium 38_11]|nr:MAG: FeoA domain protein [Clostridiales bacterium 38_11]HBH11942.1 ferrous iron transport protein A [Clostridiales bacterium]
MNRLSDLKPGEKGVIKSIDIDGAIKIRMTQLGITEGETVQVEKYAPLGDPIEISIRGYSLCFRKTEAERIILV